jgi:hypothetical protein
VSLHADEVHGLAFAPKIADHCCYDSSTLKIPQSIVDEIKVLNGEGLRPPKKPRYFGSQASAFTYPESEVVLTSRDERPGEQKILSLHGFPTHIKPH